MERVKLSAVNLLSFSEENAARNRRRPGRVRCEMLPCTGGTVVDLSATGARLRLRRLGVPAKGSTQTIQFLTSAGQSLPFKCRLAWTKRLGIFTCECGVEFLHVDQARADQLKEVARMYRERGGLPTSNAA